MPLDITINNSGAVDATDAIVQTEVFLFPDLVTPIQSITSSANALVAGNSTTITNGNFAPTIEGDYFFRHVVSSTLLTDSDITNDTVQYYLNIEQTFGRDVGVIDGSLGIGAGAADNGVLGQNYTMTAAGEMDSIAVYINNGGTGGNTMVG